MSLHFVSVDEMFLVFLSVVDGVGVDGVDVGVGVIDKLYNTKAVCPIFYAVANSTPTHLFWGGLLNHLKIWSHLLVLLFSTRIYYPLL